MTICRTCGADVRETGHDLGCQDIHDAVGIRTTQSSLRPPPPNRESRMGVTHQSASSAVTYTTESRGRGCRLHVPARLLQPNQGTMTRNEYLAWETEHEGVSGD